MELNNDKISALLMARLGCSALEAEATLLSLYTEMRDVISSGGTINLGGLIKISSVYVPSRTHHGFGRVMDVPGKRKLVTQYNPSVPLLAALVNTAPVEDEYLPVPIFPADRVEPGESSERILNRANKAADDILNRAKKVDPGLQSMINGLFPDK